MKVLKSYIRFILDIFIFAYGFCVYQFSSKMPLGSRTPPAGYQSLIRLYCFTSGKSNDFLSTMISFCKKPNKIVKSTGILGDLDSKEINNISNDIRINGYHIFNNRLSSNIVKALYEFATVQTCYPRATDGEMILKKNKIKYDPNCLKSSVYDFDPNDLLKNKDIQEILKDLSFTSIAQAYLKTSPQLELPVLWWSTPYLKKADSNSAQLFHFDMDRIKWLKFFIFLTDVTINNGPHIFIKGTHRSGNIPKDLLKLGYSRLTDEDILKYYPKEDLQVFTVPAGSIIAEDTRGLHKGTNLIHGERLVLELQFSNCLFGAESI